VSYEVASKRVQTDHIEDMPKLTNDAYKTIIDADNTRTKGDGSCMEICGDEDWVQKYGHIVWPPEEVIPVHTSGVKKKEGVDSSERVKIRYNGMSQCDHQMVTDNQDSAVDSKVDARGPSANLSSTWKEDSIQLTRPRGTAQLALQVLEARMRTRVLLQRLWTSIGGKSSYWRLWEKSGQS
jgi:hypothetical protein